MGEWLAVLLSLPGVIVLAATVLSVINQRRLIRWLGCAAIVFVSIWAMTQWLIDLPNLLVQVVQEGVRLAGQTVSDIPRKFGNVVGGLLGQPPTPDPTQGPVNLTGILLTKDLRLAVVSGVIFIIRLMYEVVREKGVGLWHYLWDPSR